MEFGEKAVWTENLRRKEQDSVDCIIQGREPGHYFVLLGSKVGSMYLPSWYNSIKLIHDRVPGKAR